MRHNNSSVVLAGVLAVHPRQSQRRPRKIRPPSPPESPKLFLPARVARVSPPEWSAKLFWSKLFSQPCHRRVVRRPRLPRVPARVVRSCQSLFIVTVVISRVAPPFPPESSAKLIFRRRVSARVVRRRIVSAREVGRPRHIRRRPRHSRSLRHAPRNWRLSPPQSPTQVLPAVLGRASSCSAMHQSRLPSLPAHQCLRPRLCRAGQSKKQGSAAAWRRRPMV